MPFEAVPGLKGNVYVPDRCRSGTGKYPCRDCYSCQHCSDDRCRVCRKPPKGKCPDELASIKGDPALSTCMAPYGCGVME